jgi:hypothetical protein
MTDNLPATTETNPLGSTGPKGIPIERILALKAKKLTLGEMSKLLGCSEANIKKRLADMNIETLNDFTEQKALVYDVIESRHINKLLDGNSKRPMEDMTIAAIAGDKGRLIRGQSTSIIEVRSLQVDLNKAIDAMRAEQGSIIDIPVDNPVDSSTCQPSCPQRTE